MRWMGHKGVMEGILLPPPSSSAGRSHRSTDDITAHIDRGTERLTQLLLDKTVPVELWVKLAGHTAHAYRDTH